jgi:hypothetical protein
MELPSFARTPIMVRIRQILMTKLMMLILRIMQSSLVIGRISVLMAGN